MNCPRCETPLEAKLARDVTIHACASCGGVWLDKAQTDAVFTQTEGGLAIVDATETAAHGSAKRRSPIDPVARCPIGGEELVLCEAEGIEIDRCPAHGTWFDAHEVRRIVHGEAHAETPSAVTTASSAPKQSSSIGEWIEAFVDALIEGPRRGGPPTH